MLKSHVQESRPVYLNFFRNFLIAIAFLSLHSYSLKLENKIARACSIEILRNMPFITLIATKNIIILILNYNNSIISIFAISVESLDAGAIIVNRKQKAPLSHLNEHWQVHRNQINMNSINYSRLMFCYRYKIR